MIFGWLILLMEKELHKNIKIDWFITYTMCNWIETKF